MKFLGVEVPAVEKRHIIDHKLTLRQIRDMTLVYHTHQATNATGLAIESPPVDIAGEEWHFTGEVALGCYLFGRGDDPESDIDYHYLLLPVDKGLAGLHGPNLDGKAAYLHYLLPALGDTPPTAQILATWDFFALGQLLKLLLKNSRGR